MKDRRRRGRAGISKFYSNAILTYVNLLAARGVVLAAADAEEVRVPDEDCPATRRAVEASVVSVTRLLREGCMMVVICTEQEKEKDL